MALADLLAALTSAIPRLWRRGRRWWRPRRACCWRGLAERNLRLREQVVVQNQKLLRLAEAQFRAGVGENHDRRLMRCLKLSPVRWARSPPDRTVPTASASRTRRGPPISLK